MPLTITPESKNTALSITNESKATGGTFADFPVAWSSVTTPWGFPGLPIIKESKNSLTVSNESKN